MDWAGRARDMTTSGANLNRSLSPLFEPFSRSDAPGLAVAVRCGADVFRRDYGLSSLEQGVVIGPQTRMRIGSTTKQFTCLAVMLLVEDGRLDIDVDIRRWLTELHHTIPAISARQLMQHTAGVLCHLDLWSILSGMTARWSEDGVFDLLARTDHLNFQPGADFSYSNGGYVLLTRLVERVSGLDLGEFLKTRILDPCGLHDTELLRHDGKLRSGNADLHVKDGETWRRGHMSVPLAGEGGLISTADDLLAWTGQMSAPRVGSTATWQALTEPAPVGTGGRSDYGLGLITRSYRGVKTIGHAGAVVGGRCELLTVPDHGLDIVLLANRSDIALRDLTARIVDAVLESVLDPAPDRPSAETMATVSGVYAEPGTGRFLALSVEGGLPVIDFGSARASLWAVGDALRFSGALGDMDIAPGSVPGPVVEALDVTECGLVHRFERIAGEAGPLPEGRYINADFDAEATIVPGGMGGELRLRVPHGQVVYRATGVAVNVWSLRDEQDPSAWSLLQVDGEPGRRRLRISTLRTRRLTFVEVAAG